jgi:type I restriction enzyme M protein
MGGLVDRTHRELSDFEIERIAGAYRRWKGTDTITPYADDPGFCREASIDDMRRHNYALVAGRYVGFSPTAIPEWDPQSLRTELAVMRERIDEVQDASQGAFSLMEDLLRG